MYRELTNEQARQSIDAEQVFSAYRDVERELADRFYGTMNWRAVNEADYLYRIRGHVAKSLGPRSAETEAIYESFRAGKARAENIQKQLGGRLNSMAPVNRAYQLGRVPLMTARILRAATSNGLLGRSLFVVGTNAIFGYERLCSVQIEGGLLATGDVDLLFDSRRNLKLASTEIAQRGLVGMLRRLDSTFDLTARGSFRAVNADGFMVDLIKPPPRDRLISRGQSTLSSVAGDLTAAEIEGLGWLVNVAKITQTVIDERGYPLEIVSPDPRAFALHKFWLSKRADRDPNKRKRDEAQAKLVAELISTRVPALSFSDDMALSALPKALVSHRGELVNIVGQNGGVDPEPNW